MRIPYKINKNTLKAFEASPECLILLGECKRCLFSEALDWDKAHCPSLVTMCIEAINKNFENEPILDELLCEDRDYLIEILNIELPLKLVIPLIEEEIYWKRRYCVNYGEVIFFKPEEETWKVLYIERYIQETLEKAEPQYNDEDNLSELTTLCAPYVGKLKITQLQAWRPPLHWDEEDIPEVYPTDHINFEPIFKELVNIKHLDIVYGMNHTADTFAWNMFKLSVGDCHRLGKAIHHLKSLRVLKIHRSQLKDAHIRALMQGFIKNETVEELDLSHCLIGDEGALCIAKILCVHPNLRILNLCNNRIGQLGCEGLGFALLDSNCLLEKLDLKLNPLHEGGAMGIMRALVRGTTLTDLSMAACEYNDEAPFRTGQMIILNKSLKKLNISNNWFDVEGGQALIDGLAINRTLEYLDMRETDIPAYQQAEIKKCLLRNRLGYEEVEKSTESVESENGSPITSEIVDETAMITQTTSVVTEASEREN